MSRNGQGLLRCGVLRAGQRASLTAAFMVAWVVLPALVNAADTPEKAPNPAQIEIDKYLERVAKGDVEPVIAETTKAITADPKKSHLAHVGRGIALNAKRDFSKAIEDLDVAAEVSGRSDEALAIRAAAFKQKSIAMYETREYLQAIDNAYFSLLEKGDDPETHVRRAMGYIGWNKADKAIGSAGRALYYDANNADAISIRGVGYGMKNSFDKCIEDQTKAIALNKNKAEYYERRANAYLAKKDLEKASKDVIEALRINPDLADALCSRAIIQAMTGKMSEAMSDLDLAIKKDPGSFRAHFQKAMVLQFQKQNPAALSSANDCLRLNPTFVPGLLLRGNLHNDMKDAKAAVEDFTAAIEQDPKSAAAYSGRSAAYRKLGDTEKAKADTVVFRELQPAPAGKTAKKAPEEPIPTFKVTSQGVNPSGRARAVEASRKIDGLVGVNYEKFKIEPNPVTSDWQFVRRIYLDITGAIPTYQQTLKFVNSKDADKRANLIDELLASETYAGHQFNYWADILRYSDRLNENVRGEPYRQWLKQSLAENKPWDKMVQEMLTAEGFIWQNPATGYMQRDSNMPLDNMNNTVRIFLGTRIGCAQCHNHPFDRWTQKEFYQMAAFTFGTTTSTGFNDKRFWESKPDDRLRDEYEEIVQEEEDRRNNSYAFDQTLRVNKMIVNNQPTRVVRLPKDYAYDDAKPNDTIKPETLFGSKAEVRPGESQVQAFARWLTAKDNPRFAKTIANRLWEQAFGIAQIDPVDDMTDHTVAENPALMDFLEAQMKDLDFDMKEFKRMLYYSQTYQRRACFDEIPVGAPFHFPGPALRRMTAEQVWDSFLTLAVEDPDGYRQLPAEVRTAAYGFDLSKATAQEVMASPGKRSAVDRLQYKLQDKHKYKGLVLGRASELPSPLPPNHFIRTFGQSDRELIAASSTTGSVPQVLFMFNGPISHMLLEKNSTIYNNVVRKKTVPDGVKVVFHTILNRDPDSEDLALAAEEIRKNGPAGYGNVIWALVNTREFLFIQ